MLVHGAWHGAWVWQRVAERLSADSTAVDAVELPGLDRAPGGHDLAGHVEHLRGVLARCAEPVLLVGHSYGGAVITAAAAGAPNVAGLVYVAAFQLAEGESCADRNVRAPGELPPYTRHGDYLYVDPDRARARFFPDCAPDTAAAASARLTPEHLDTVRAPVTEAGWRTIPSTYVLCGADTMLPARAQRLMAARADRVVEMDAGHSPMLSRPDELAEILGGIARDPVGQVI